MGISFINQEIEEITKIQTTFIKVRVKNLSEYIFRQLKKHQDKIGRETGISFETTLNVFKCFIVSLVPLTFLLRQQHHFYL